MYSVHKYIWQYDIHKNDIKYVQLGIMIGEFYAYILHKMYIMAKKVLAYDLISGQIRTCKVVRAIFKCWLEM